MKKLLLSFLLLNAGFLFAQSADFIASPVTICTGGSVQFTDASTGATSWSWTFIDGGSGQTSSLQNPNIIYSIAGTYTVILTVTNGVTSDTEIKSGYITVVNNATISLISSVGSDNQTVCENNPLSPTITYSLVGGTGVIVSGLPPGVSSSFTPDAFGGTVSLFGSPTAPGIYNYNVTSTGGNCAPVVANGTITVQASPTMTLVSAAGTDNQTVCASSSIAPIDYVFGGSATGTITSGLPAGVSSSTVGNMTSITGSPTVSGSFPYSISTTGSSCPAITLNGLITVDQLPTLTLNSAAGTDNQTVCENSPIAPVSIAVGGSATGANAVGLPAGVTGGMISTNFIISGTPTIPGTYNYTLSSTGGACAPAIFNGTIVVSSAPVITLTSPVGTDNQVICEANAISTITYNIGGSATGATVSGLPSGTTGSYSAGTFTISGTPVGSGLFNYTVTTTGGPCTPATVAGTIQIDATPTIVLSSAAGTDNQTICQNSALTTITYTIGGSATGASFSGLPAGVSGNVAGTTVTISGSPTLVGTFNYLITTTGGSCAPTNISGSIISEPAPTATLTSPVGTDNQVICEANAITTITYNIGGSATGATVSGLPSGTTGSYSAGTFTISGMPVGSGLFNYTVTTTGGPCTPATASGTIQIDATPTIVLSSAAGTDNQTICQNSALTTITYTMGGSATGASFSGLPAGVSGNVAGTTVTISGSPTLVGTFNYLITTTGGSCAPTNISGSIISEPAPTATLTSPVGTDNQTICQGAAITTITYNIGGSATGATVSGLPSGVTGSYSAGTFTISGTPAVAGTFSYTVTTTGGTCAPASISGNIFVQNSQITLTSATYSNHQEICLGNAINTITYDAGGPVITNDLPAGLTVLYSPGSPNTLTISGTPSVNGSFYYTVSAAGGCGSNVVVGSIVVAAPITGNTSGSNLTVCEESTFNLIGGSLSASINPYTFLWEAATTAAGPFVTAQSINSASNYSGVASFSDPLIYFRRIVSNGLCSDTASVVQVSIDSLPSITTIPSWTICSSDSALLSGIVLSNGTISSWNYSGSGQLINGSPEIFVPGNGEAGTTVQIPFTVSSTNSCALANVDGIANVIVMSDPMATLSGSATVCANGNSVAINGASVANGTYSWIHDGAGTLGGIGTLNPLYNTVIADTGSTITVSLVATSNAGCMNTITDTASFTIQVSPYGINPGINAFAGTDETISLGSSANLVGDGVAITNWTWSPSVGLSDSTIYNPTANPTQTTTYVLTVTDINGCMDTDSLTIFVDTDYDVFIPNLFTPNGDGSNDSWEIPEIANYPNTEVTIINREGQVVYSTDNYDNSWDGTSKGKNLPEATYYYLINFENSDKEYKGAVSILRNNK